MAERFATARVALEADIPSLVQISRRAPSSGKPQQMMDVPSSYPSLWPLWAIDGAGEHIFIISRQLASGFSAFPVQCGIRCTSLCTLVFLLRHMQILFAISIVCFLALLWAGIAIARHIYKGHQDGQTSTQSQGDFAHHLFAATENRAVRQPRTVVPQTVGDVAAKKSWNSGPAPVEIHPSARQQVGDSSLDGQMDQRRSHAGATERLDWAYFNKDAGDLTDPYQIRRFRDNSGARAT